MIIAGTGHRPDKLGGYGSYTHAKLLDLAEASLELYAPDTVISGMALGWDMALAEAAINCNISLVAAIPCPSQDSKWNPVDKLKYKELLSSATEVCTISPNYHPGVMQARNEWMVNRCHLLLALWDGGESGGTYNCIKYARKKSVSIDNIWEIYKNL